MIFSGLHNIRRAEVSDSQYGQKRDGKKIQLQFDELS